jgi:hypothetical protein
MTALQLPTTFEGQYSISTKDSTVNRTWGNKMQSQILPTRITKMHYAHSPNTPNKIKQKNKPYF